MQHRVKILIIDDQKLFADSLRAVLESEVEDVKEVIVEYGSKAGLEAARRVDPDVVLMDIQMPDLDGIQATAEIVKRNPRVKVIMLTAFGYESYVQQALKSGAAGFLLKDVHPDQLLESIKSVCKGIVVLTDQVRNIIVPRDSDPIQAKAPPDWFFLLTYSEKRILSFISKGFSNAEIADSLSLSSQTIRNYISTLYEKIGAGNRFEAMRIAIEADVPALIRDEFGHTP
jgi:DNA-binding NarL/FixJ family response regulator